MCRWLLLSLSARAGSHCRSHPEQGWWMTHLINQIKTPGYQVGTRLWCWDWALASLMGMLPVSPLSNRLLVLRYLREMLEAHLNYLGRVWFPLWGGRC